MYRKKGGVFMTGLVYPSTSRNTYKEIQPLPVATHAHVKTAVKANITLRISSHCVKPLVYSLDQMSKDITYYVIKSFRTNCLPEEE